MERVLFNSDQEYFQYCIDREIGDVGNHLCYLSNCETLKVPHFGVTSKGETILIDSKPSHYPCMLVWYTNGGGETYRGTFVYHDEF